MATIAQGWLGHVATAVITAAVTIFGAYTQLQGEIVTSDVDQSRLFLTRMTELDTRIDSLQREMTKIQIENSQVKAENVQLKVQINLLRATITETGDVASVYRLLESLDVPAWCKKWTAPNDKRDDWHFEMGYINAAYEFTYKISKARYVGSTDFDIHPVKIATVFTENDMRTLAIRGWLDFTETIKLPDGTKESRRFWKFYHAVPKGPEMVCGWEVPL